MSFLLLLDLHMLNLSFVGICCEGAQIEACVGNAKLAIGFTALALLKF